MVILIVDDLEVNRKLLRVTLNASSWRTLEAEDGCQALEVLRREKVDCVVTDVLMPLMDGYRLCQEIRADKRLHALPVIVYTSTYTSPGDKKLALESGADVYLKKPVSGEIMLKAIREVTLRRGKKQRKIVHPDVILKQFNATLISKLEERNIQLEQEQEKFRQITEAIQEVFWMTNADLSQMIYISPAYEKIWGRSCASLYESASRWNEAVHEDDREQALQAAVAHSKTGGVTEYRIVRPDGTVRWIRNCSFPVKDTAGKIYRVTGVATDITEERLMATQFYQAQKMEAIGRLAGGVAHDFNNLLTAILGLSELSLRALPANHAIRPDLEEIKATGYRAAQLTQQLLAFSRRQVFEPKIVDLNSLVKKAEKMLTRIIGEEVPLSLKLAADLESVMVDPGQIEQVLVNLCVNARDATSKGGQVIVETRSVSLTKERHFQRFTIPRGEYVTMSVSDSGDGMSAEVKAHLFEPLFTTKAVGKGTGLGLPTCFGIIKQSRGFIQVESELEKGSQITIYFPRTREATFGSNLPEREITARGEGTILVAEDEPAVRRLTCRILRSAGYTLLEASNGEEALKILEQDTKQAICLLVTDVVMPLMNGKKLVEELKVARPQIKVIFTSGYPDETFSKDGVLEREVSFLRKPFTVESLTQKVRVVLDSI